MPALKHIALSGLIALSMVLVNTSTASADDSAELRRFGLVIGANDGGEGRVKLRHAVSDAENFAGVLEDLGGVHPDRLQVVEQPSPAEFEALLDETSARLTAAKDKARRVEFVLYYSGHSDREGLLLGDETLSYDALRRDLDKLPADVRLVVLDSCASGELTRTKGGERRKPFLIDESSEVRGVAILTSSSADEAAQESDAIGASFFTHFLVSGLRGAADVNQDNLVTLNEAYQFTFQETLARTQTTSAGAQHAEYDMDLSGRGDLVLTDLRKTAATLVLDAELTGRFYIKAVGGNLAVELEKSAGESLSIGLPEGSYVILRSDDGFSSAQTSVDSGERGSLDQADFGAISATEARQRGSTFSADLDADAATRSSDGSQAVELSDKLNLRQGMQQVRFGAGILGGTGKPVYGLALDFNYRTAINEDIDFQLPLIISGRLFENEHFTVAVDGGLAGLGYATVGGFSTAETFLVAAQARLTDNIAFTLSPRILASQEWGEQGGSGWLAASSLTLDWRIGRRLIGGIGAQLSYNRRASFYGMTLEEPRQTAYRHDRTVVHFGSVGGHSGFGTPLMQVRVGDGLYLYESSRLEFDVDGFDLYDHWHVLGLNWYF